MRTIKNRLLRDFGDVDYIADGAAVAAAVDSQLFSLEMQFTSSQSMEGTRSLTNPTEKPHRNRSVYGDALNARTKGKDGFTYQEYVISFPVTE